MMPKRWRWRWLSFELERALLRLKKALRINREAPKMGFTDAGENQSRKGWQK